jgi:CysZ protein
MIKKFALGFHSYFSGLGFWTKNSSLLRLSLIPLVINFVFLCAGLVYSINHISDVVSHIVSQPEAWYQYILYYFVVILTTVSLFLIVVFIVLTLANVLAFPFNSLLAERALRIHEPAHGGKGQWFAKAKANLAALFRRTLVFLIVGCLLIIATLIPGLGVIGAGVGVFLMAYDRLDYGFDHFAWTFQQRKRFVRGNFWEIMGFAVGLGLTTSIPMLNILIQPGSVVAGSLMVAKINRREVTLEGSHSQAPRQPPTTS